MKEFLCKCDTPRWVFFLFFALCYMHSVLGEKLEAMRREKYERLTGEDHP